MTKEQILALAGKPVGVFADVNKLTPEHGPRWEHMVDESFDGVDYVHFYTADQLLAVAKPLEDEIARLKQQLEKQTKIIEHLSDTATKLAVFAKHSNECSWVVPLPTGEGRWGCDCGLSILVLDGELTDAAKGGE